MEHPGVVAVPTDDLGALSPIAPCELCVRYKLKDQDRSAGSPQQTCNQGVWKCMGPSIVWVDRVAYALLVLEQ